MRELTYFILGVIVSIPIAILGPLLTPKLQNRFAARNEKRASIRSEIIERELAEARSYHEDPIKLLRYISSRLLWLTVFWIGQSIIDVIFGFISNAAYLAAINVGPLVPLNFNEVASWANALASLVDVIILTWIFRSGLRAFRIVTRVTNFESYELYVNGELEKLRSVTLEPEIS